MPYHQNGQRQKAPQGTSLNVASDRTDRVKRTAQGRRGKESPEVMTSRSDIPVMSFNWCLPYQVSSMSDSMHTQYWPNRIFTNNYALDNHRNWKPRNARNTTASVRPGEHSCRKIGHIQVKVAQGAGPTGCCGALKEGIWLHYWIAGNVVDVIHRMVHAICSEHTESKNMLPGDFTFFFIFAWKYGKE